MMQMTTSISTTLTDRVTEITHQVSREPSPPTPPRKQKTIEYTNIAIILSSTIQKDTIFDHIRLHLEHK